MAPALTLPNETQESYTKPSPQKPVAQDVDVQEDYHGQYRFAPIEEAQVSRAMIKR